MDPYLEHREIWRDFHNGLIFFIKSALQPQLRPRFAGLLQNRLMDSERAVIGMAFDDLQKSFLQILDLKAGNRVVTAVEILSPDDKEPGDSRFLYHRTRERLLGAGVNLVEIDLLRLGEPTIPLDRPCSSAYLVAVTRWMSGRQQKVYPIPLQQRLPSIPIPLDASQPDVAVDLQVAFARNWEISAYPEILGYEGPPPGPLSSEESAWCESILRAAGLRPAS